MQKYDKAKSMPAVYTDKNYMPFDGLYFIIG